MAAGTTEPSTIWYWRVTRLGVRALALAVAAAAAWDSLPAFFMALAAIMVLLALAALFQSLRTAFDDGTAAAPSGGLPERAALLDEKNALLRAIKDIAYEHEVGKLSDADFQRLDRAYRHRAKEVLKKLDEDLAPFLERAERLVREAAAPEAPAEPKARSAPKASAGKKKKKAKPRVECPSCGASNPADAERCTKCAARIALVCDACKTRNEPDATFCKKCAARLDGASEPDAPEPTRAADDAVADADAESGPGSSEPAGDDA